jgi:hypothetical protein
MTINHEKKLIFIHIPKNAGTSIIKSMGVNNVYMDKKFQEYKEHYKEYWNHYTKFTVVRDPLDRIISSYKFSRMDESSWFSTKIGEEEVHPHYEICQNMNINEYINFLYSDRNNHTLWTFPQTFFIQNKSNEISEIDIIIRYENLLSGLKKIGIDSIEHLNKSKIENEELLKIHKKSRNLLYEMYYDDYKNFGYFKNKMFYV